MKQSSVEWLVRKLSTELIGEIPMHRWDGIREAVQEAKAMHKEEYKNAFKGGIYWYRALLPVDSNRYDEDAEQYYEEYYNKTFKPE